MKTNKFNGDTLPPGRRKLSVPMLANQWGVAQKKVVDFIESGELRAINLAGVHSSRPRWAIDIDDIADFELRRQAVPKAPRVQRRRRSAVVKDYFPHLS